VSKWCPRCKCLYPSRFRDCIGCKPCVVCIDRPQAGLLLCKQCGRSYDAAKAADDGTLFAVIKWAAERARRFEARRRRA